MSKKLSLKLNKNNFTDFVAKIKDVSNINDVVKIKISKENILMYSMKSNDSAVLALKSHLMPTDEYIDDFNEDEIYDFIIMNSIKFIKGLNFFNSESQIKLDLIYKPHREEENTMQVRSAQFTNGKLKISTVGGEDSQIRNLNADMLSERTDVLNSEWQFQISKQDFIDVKKLSSIDSEEKIFTLNIEDGVVIATELGKWELELSETKEKVNSKIIFNKKYLSNINSNLEFIQFYKFETFILIKDETSILLLSFENTFDEDDN